MKSIILVLAFTVSSLLLYAGNERSGYVTSGGDTRFSKSVITGLFRISYINYEGVKVSIPYKNVEAYLTNGHLYERLPVICENGKVERTALMEFVALRNGLKLYKYCCFSEECDPAWGIFRKANPRYEYFVFRDGQFYLRIDEKNARTALPFFGVTVI